MTIIREKPLVELTLSELVSHLERLCRKWQEERIMLSKGLPYLEAEIKATMETISKIL